MRLSLKTLLNYVAVFIVFTSAWRFGVLYLWEQLGILAELRMFYFMMPLILLFYVPIIKGIYFNKTSLSLFLIITFLSLCNVFIGKNTMGLLGKQVIGISISAFFFYFILKINNYNVKELFRMYLNIAFIVALIGIIQEVSYLLGFKPGYDFQHFIPIWKVDVSTRSTLPLLRVNSIFPEPTHFCIVMMPAFFASLTSFLKNNFRFLNRWKSFIIILSYFLTFSLTGYAGIAFSLMVLAYNYRKVHYVIMFVTIICILASFSYYNMAEMRMRVDQSLNVLTGERKLEDTNLSTYGFLSNALVAYNSFKDSPLFGHGLGSHLITYERYIGKKVARSKYGHALNRDDAGSLLFRLLSETGLFGILIFFGFIFKFHIPRKETEGDYLWIISNAVLAMFFIKLLRFGNYFVDGFFFFFWMYYFSKIKLRLIRPSNNS